MIKNPTFDRVYLIDAYSVIYDKMSKKEKRATHDSSIPSFIGSDKNIS